MIWEKFYEIQKLQATFITWNLPFKHLFSIEHHDRIRIDGYSLRFSAIKVQITPKQLVLLRWEYANIIVFIQPANFRHAMFVHTSASALRKNRYALLHSINKAVNYRRSIWFSRQVNAACARKFINLYDRNGI